MSGEGETELVRDYGPLKTTNFKCSATSSKGAALKAALSSGKKEDLEWIINDKQPPIKGTLVVSGIMPDSTTTTTVQTYQIRCIKTEEELWSGTIRFYYLKGPVTSGGTGGTGPGGQPTAGGGTGGSGGPPPTIPAAPTPGILPPDPDNKCPK
ncbi:hypothetical protein [Gimesia alba]|uniref:hypothetical protein n=1 Tax=Gimesia alba TaxID=2527973 RepID=UPI00119F9F80|nr:hypothetical protein [Gimesia alba]